jgi:hypothetical protein
MKDTKYLIYYYVDKPRAGSNSETGQLKGILRAQDTVGIAGTSARKARLANIKSTHSR